MQDLWGDSYLSEGNEAYLENLYETYLHSPDEVAPEWQLYFKEMAAAEKGDMSHEAVRRYFSWLARETATSTGSQQQNTTSIHGQEKVFQLISAYRAHGHLQANIDPLGLYKGFSNPTLELTYYGFTDADLDTVFDVGSFAALKKRTAPLREIFQALRDIYCGSIGVEYMHIEQQEEVNWLQQALEQSNTLFKPTSEEKQRILHRLVQAEGLEKYIGLKYVGQKRFSLEGGDSLVPLLDVIVTHGANYGTKEIVIGMAHRGRLNVLVNILGKESEKVFAGFEGKGIPETHSGDVKYHMGYSSDVKTASGPVHLALAFNPSHLEIVSPVVQGSVRARQRRRRDTDQKQVMAVQIHGDAAFAGQGVVMETFNMSQTRWFTVGGSVHIVINNQVGFTTSNPLDARSSMYCTDVAKMVSPPIFHVNGNDPDAVFFVGKLAVEYREKFKKDVVIDLVCYRRHGHNEADEPSATQPIMYQVIKTLPTPSAMYAKQLIAEGVIDQKTAKQMADDYRQLLDEGKSVVTLMNEHSAYEYSHHWQPFIHNDWKTAAKTAVPLKKITELADKMDQFPADFIFQAQVKKMLEARQKMTAGDMPINWGYAENMAYATLLDEGYPIRLCGEDVGRGTFAHRHAVLHHQHTDEIYIPLSHLSKNQAQINIIDSLLSEEAVLAFEYGYASTEPNYLVIWEAQFGDFANGAQVVIDQFISSGEQKWNRLCGLIMQLPHGYEGQGPEHSSARLERYLQLCAQQNMQVCVPTTPAQMFHLLRRQMIRPYRKPLVIMTPKSLLRHHLAVSLMSDLTDGEFQVVIPEIDQLDSKKIDKLIACSGKVYYDLLEKRRELKKDTVAIVRVEQLYPFPEEAFKSILASYKQVKRVIWCQEEPRNQGAWYSIQHRLLACLEEKQKLGYAGRKASASPAAGYLSMHLKEQDALVTQALTENE